MIAASVLLLVVARTVYKKNQITRRPPVVSHLIPWVGSALDLGKSPDAFFRRAMCVKLLFIRLGAEDELALHFSATYGDIFTVKSLGRSITYVTSPHVRNIWNSLTIMHVG